MDINYKVIKKIACIICSKNNKKAKHFQVDQAFFGKYLSQHKNDRRIADDLWADSFGLAARDAAANHDIWVDRGQGRADRYL